MYKCAIFRDSTRFQLVTKKNPTRPSNHPESLEDESLGNAQSLEKVNAKKVGVKFSRF